MAAAASRKITVKPGVFPSDRQLRITALENAVRINSTGNNKMVLDAAKKFYDFLTAAA